MSSPYSLEGKKAFVTGGKRRIGRGIALALAETGCDVGINDLTRDQDSEETLRLIRAGGRQAEIFEGDISDASQVERMFALYLQRFGRIDILINNAGIHGPQVPVEDYPLENWQRVIMVAWVASPACSYSTGACFDVSGGRAQF